MATMKIHFSAPHRINAAGIADGTACRPDGQHGRELHATSVDAYVTCVACIRVLH